MVTYVERATTAPAAFAASVATMPAGLAVKDRVLLFVMMKPDTLDDPTVDQGFVKIGSATGGTGVVGVDTGPCKMVAFAKDWAGTEGAVTVTPGANPGSASWVFVAVAWRPDPGKDWAFPVQANATWVGMVGDVDATAASGLTGSITLGETPQAGDALSAFGVTPSDGTATVGLTFTAAGLTGGTKTFGSRQVQGLGNDCSGMSGRWDGFTGTATGPLVPTFTFSGNNASGVVGVALLRDVQTRPIVNITSAPATIEAGATQTATAVGTPVSPATITSYTWRVVSTNGATPTLTPAGATCSIKAPPHLTDSTVVIGVIARDSNNVDSDESTVTITLRASTRRVKIGGVMVPIYRRFKLP